VVLTDREIRDKYRYDEVPKKVDNYIYATTTATGNLRGHLQRVHTELYDRTCEENKWNYKPKVTAAVVGANRKSELPAFSPEMFLDYLVRFVTSDDQVC